MSHPRNRDRQGTSINDESVPPDALPEPTEAEVADPPATDPDAGGAQSYKDRWLRTEADFQNFRRRAARENEEIRRAAEERVMMEMVLALDDLERAIDAARDAGAPESWTDGVRLVVNRMADFLSRQGVRVLHPHGEPFDPRFHEAMLEVDAPDVEPGHVVQVVLRGYARGDRVLRPARVVVAKRNGA